MREHERAGEPFREVLPLAGEAEVPGVKAKRGYRLQKADSPAIGRWLKRYYLKRTCRHGVPLVNKGNYTKTSSVGEEVLWELMQGAE